MGTFFIIGQQISSRHKYIGIDFITHELQTGARLFPNKCLDGVPLIKCALVAHPDECAIGTRVTLMPAPVNPLDEPSLA